MVIIVLFIDSALEGAQKNDNDIWEMTNAYERTGMKVILYFDWVGSRKELKSQDNKMQKSCKETGVQYMGIHGPQNQKWNYAWLFDVKSFDHFMEMTAKVPRPPQMTHYITELLIPVQLPVEQPQMVTLTE